MRQGELLPLSQAARSLGVSIDALQTHIDQGQIPTARSAEGQWYVSASALAELAQQQGLRLELRTTEDTSHPPAHSEILAAQAAVLLAKTQAAAAHFQSQDFLRRLRDANSAAEVDRQARQQADLALSEAEEALTGLREGQAVAETKVEELRTQLISDERNFQFVIERVAYLERDRERLIRSLGWFGRLRYRQITQHPLVPQTPAPEPTTNVDHTIDLTRSTEVGGEQDLSTQSASEPRDYPPPETIQRVHRTTFDPGSMVTTHAYDALT